MSKRHPKFADLPDAVPAKQVEPVVAQPDVPQTPANRPVEWQAPVAEEPARKILGQEVKRHVHSWEK